MSDKPAIHVLEPFPFWGRGHSETCYNICSHWATLGQNVRIFTLSAHRADPASVLVPSLPSSVPQSLKGYLTWSKQSGRLQRLAEWRFLRQVRPGDLCYFWPGSRIGAIEAAKSRGGVVVIEFINTHLANNEKILSAAATELGLSPVRFEAEAHEIETARLEIADIVIAPGPFVSSSIREFGHTDAHVIESSYGTHPGPPCPEPTRVPSTLRFIFVGASSLRKGLFTLLDAWQIANLDAELLLVGEVYSDVNDRVAELADRRIRSVGHQPSVSEFYSQSDVFVFPSLEEGDPQVTYEAAAHGLPLIVTPMGGGRIASSDNAIVVPPRDSHSLAAALTKLHSDPDARRRMSRAAWESAKHFEWPKVSERRLEMLLDAADRVRARRR